MWSVCLITLVCVVILRLWKANTMRWDVQDSPDTAQTLGKCGEGPSHGSPCRSAQHWAGQPRSETFQSQMTPPSKMCPTLEGHYAWSLVGGQEKKILENDTRLRSSSSLHTCTCNTMYTVQYHVCYMYMYAWTFGVQYAMDFTCRAYTGTRFVYSCYVTQQNTGFMREMCTCTCPYMYVHVHTCMYICTPTQKICN